MWILIVWALSGSGDIQPKQALVSLSKKDCHAMETFVNSQKFNPQHGDDTQYVAECIQSNYY